MVVALGKTTEFVAEFMEIYMFPRADYEWGDSLEFLFVVLNMINLGL